MIEAFFSVVLNKVFFYIGFYSHVHGEKNKQGESAISDSAVIFFHSRSCQSNNIMSSEKNPHNNKQKNAVTQ